MDRHAVSRIGADGMGRLEVVKAGGSFADGLEGVGERHLRSGLHILKADGCGEGFLAAHPARVPQRVYANHLRVGRHIQGAEQREPILIGGVQNRHGGIAPSQYEDGREDGRGPGCTKRPE